ncbi:MAG: ABC transporter permease [Synergistaceae bacterium]|jgi:ABC-2 type transport system permease protein|nr:ABC transporter permease [Synergistaceae bacterium]
MPMRDFISGVLNLVRKEALMIFKDRGNRLILVVPVVVQTLIFGYVATFDLNRADYALLDEDHSRTSLELTRRFDGSGVFRRVATLNNASDIAGILDGQKALMVLHIGPQFERGLNAGQTVKTQVLLDGRNSNVAGIAASYAASIIDAYNGARLREKGISPESSGPTISVTSRAWFNPNLETRWNILSGLIAMLSVIQAMVLAGQSVAREREHGTYDQLLVTPYGPMTLMLGKALPPVLIGTGQSTLVLLVARYWFGIPFAGSYALLYAGLLLFGFAVTGIGLCISALTFTMQQALLFTFTLLMPMVLLAGLVTPIESMPKAFQWATLINPVRYGVEFTQRIYLEGAGMSEMKGIFPPLAAIAAVTLGTASRLFRGKMG